jgi:hypothetical protein
MPALLRKWRRVKPELPIMMSLHPDASLVNSRGVSGRWALTGVQLDFADEKSSSSVPTASETFPSEIRRCGSSS